MKGVSSQCDKIGVDHPVTFCSRKLIQREMNYSKIEKNILLSFKEVTTTSECIYWGVIVHTDHQALEWLHILKDNNAGLT